MLYYYCNAPITLNNTSPSQVFQCEEFGMACYTRSSFLKKFPFSSNKKSINEYMNRKIQKAIKQTQHLGDQNKIKTNYSIFIGYVDMFTRLVMK